MGLSIFFDFPQNLFCSFCEKKFRFKKRNLDKFQRYNSDTPFFSLQRWWKTSQIKKKKIYVSKK